MSTVGVDASVNVQQTYRISFEKIDPGIVNVVAATSPEVTVRYWARISELVEYVTIPTPVNPDRYVVSAWLPAWTTIARSPAAVPVGSAIVDESVVDRVAVVGVPTSVSAMGQGLPSVMTNDEIDTGCPDVIDVVTSSSWPPPPVAVTDPSMTAVVPSDFKIRK